MYGITNEGVKPVETLCEHIRGCQAPVSRKFSLATGIKNDGIKCKLSKMRPKSQQSSGAIISTHSGILAPLVLLNLFTIAVRSMQHITRQGKRAHWQLFHSNLKTQK